MPEAAGARTPSACGCSKDDLYRGRDGDQMSLMVPALRLRTSVSVHGDSEGAGTLPIVV